MLCSRTTVWRQVVLAAAVQGADLRGLVKALGPPGARLGIQAADRQLAGRLGPESPARVTGLGVARCETC